MRHWVWPLGLALVLVGAASCTHHSEVHQGPPLLLEEPGAAETPVAPQKGPVADNSRCHVCHMNYEEEELALAHASGNIGCEQCHGDSTPHCSDENNVTPPDIMYPTEKINPSCLKCHPGEKLTDVHKPFLAGLSEEKYCSDCHGEHRLTYRTRRWDKATRKLLMDDGVRVLQDNPSGEM